MYPKIHIENIKKYNRITFMTNYKGTDLHYSASIFSSPTHASIFYCDVT